MSNIFNVFVRHLDVPVTCNAYRGNNGNIVVYESRAEAEAAAAKLAAANRTRTFPLPLPSLSPLTKPRPKRLHRLSSQLS